jgi:hypothetical protein
MKIYRYSISGLYIGEAEADESLLEERTYQMPANSTEIPPPPYDDGEWPVFRNGTWEIHRLESDGFLKTTDHMEIDEPDKADKYEEERHIARENLSVIVQIMEIEITEQHRAVREFALTGNRQRLEEIEKKISVLRIQLI